MCSYPGSATEVQPSATVNEFIDVRVSIDVCLVAILQSTNQQWSGLS